MLETLGAHKKNKIGPDRGQLTRPDAEVRSGIRHQQVSKWRNRLKDPDEYSDFLYGAAYRKAMGEVDLRGATGTGENDWHTPQEHLDAEGEAQGARAVKHAQVAARFL